MFKSIGTADQDDFFDFLRIENDQLAAAPGQDWIMKPRSEIKSGLSTDSLLHSFSGKAGNGRENKKNRDSFS